MENVKKVFVPSSTKLNAVSMGQILVKYIAKYQIDLTLVNPVQN